MWPKVSEGLRWGDGAEILQIFHGLLKSSNSPRAQGAEIYPVDEEGIHGDKSSDWEGGRSGCPHDSREQTMAKSQTRFLSAMDWIVGVSLKL